MSTKFDVFLILIFCIHLSSTSTSECPHPAFIRTSGLNMTQTDHWLFKLSESSIPECEKLCLNSSNCSGFYFDHKHHFCYGFGDNQTGINSSSRFITSDLFEKICLDQDRQCPPLIWHFERVLGNALSGGESENFNSTSELECLKLCLFNQNLTCTSISFNSQSQKCRLSNENRFHHTRTLKPDRDWVYVDNLCAIDFKIQCYHDNRQNLSLEVALRSIMADDFSACAILCQQETSFMCISFAFDEKIRNCELSSEKLTQNASSRRNITFGSCLLSTEYAENKPQIRGKKYSEPLFPRCPLAKLTHVGYEKVTGYRLAIDDIDENQSVLYSNNTRGVTEICLKKCTEETCSAFSLDYTRSVCNSLIPEENPELSAMSFSYFRPLCLPEETITHCTKLWFIDRVPKHRLNGDFYEVIGGISRDDCEARCLEDSTRCRSANYKTKQKECSLSESDRHTQSKDFIVDDDSEYLENQCVDETKIIRARQFSTTCTYGQAIRDSYLEFVDKTVTAASESDCRMACDSELLFNCRSYSFIPKQPTFNECFLSSDTTNSPGAQLKQLPGAVYVERTCTQTTLPQTQQPPSFPQRPPPGRPPIGFPDKPPPFQKPPIIGGPPFYPPPGPYPLPPGLPGYPRPQYPPPPPPPPPPYRAPDQLGPKCYYPTDFTFEKTMGMVPRPSSFLARADRLPLSGPSSIAPDCIHSCIERDMHCLGFVLQYPMREPPACVAFDRGLGFDRGVLVPRQNSAYMEKVCLHGRRCGKLWTFERVVGFELEGSDAKVLQFVPTKEECEDQCLSETTFECRSAEYIYSLRICRLSSETRRSRPEAFRFVGPDVDYLENQCASEPVQCEYTDFPAKMLPFADRFVPDMSSLQECQQRCDKERDFLCRSVTWNHLSSDCLLSSDDRYSTPMGINAIVDRPDWVYSEKGNCGQVHVDCSPNEMVVRVVFGSPFTGRIYAKGNPQLCTQPGANQLQVALPVPLGVQCGTVQEAPGMYTNEVVVQQHPLIMTDNDKTYRVVCSFAVTDQVVTMDSGGRLDGPSGLDVINDKGAIGSPSQIIQNSAPSPDVRLRITARNGQDVSTVGIGDELLFRVDPEPRSAFGIFARNLLAKSEFGDQLPLLDQHGCPTDINIFPALVPEPNSRALVAPFHAFRFPTTGRINFEVQITFCQEMCPPVQCMAGDVTFGRKKRSANGTSAVPPPVVVKYALGGGNPYNPSNDTVDKNDTLTAGTSGMGGNATWENGLPTKIPLPSGPAFVPLPESSVPKVMVVPNGTNPHQPEHLKQVPLRLSLLVNNQEDDPRDVGHQSAQSAGNVGTNSRNPVNPFPQNPPTMTRYDGPLIRVPTDPGFALDKVCTDKSTIVAAVLATIVTQLLLVGAGVGGYVFYRKRRRRNRRSPKPQQPVTSRNVLYGAPTDGLRPLGMRDKLPPAHASLKVSNWIQQQQKRNYDPNRINIMEMSA